MLVILYNRTVFRTCFPGCNFNEFTFPLAVGFKMEFHKMN